MWFVYAFSLFATSGKAKGRGEDLMICSGVGNA